MEGKIFMQEVDNLRGFKKHGFIASGRSGNHAYGHCCFCGKENKFYVNNQNMLWDCKVCLKKGNFKTFLKEVHLRNVKQLTPPDYVKLANNRGLPVEAFKYFQLGKHDSEYTLPTFNEQREVQDIRTYKLGKKIMSSPGCKVGLFNIENVDLSDTSKPMYLCEGEWDTIALSWLLRTLKIKADVVGVPGAQTFKREWTRYFQGRKVKVLYDNDVAGENGDQLIKERLNNCAEEIHFLHWPSSFITGFDLRDMIKREAVREGNPKRCFQLLERMLKGEPRNGSVPVSVIAGEKDAEEPVQEKLNTKVTLQDVYRTFEKWMFQPNQDAIELSIASVISNGLQGDPVWMFLVAPPGGSKTEILASFDKCPNVYVTSSLTPHALISGASFKDGMDLSLIPQLHNKTLVVKDFTSILGKREHEKDEIFSILRDAYDGKCGKVFGTGLHRYYKSHFSILSGVTPVIYELSSQYTGLGERFLKFFIGQNLDHPEEESIILRSMRNVNKELDMREELALVIRDYVKLIASRMKAETFKLPTITREMENKIVGCAQFVARMRAVVSRDRHNSEMVTSKPSAEVGSRLGKQLTKVALSIAIVNRRTEVTDHEIRIVKKLTLDTISQRTEDVFRIILKSCPTVDDSLKTKDIAFRSRYPLSTVTRLLNDMYLLDIVKKTGSLNKLEWTISDYMRNLIKNGSLYRSQEEINRPLRSTLRIRIKK